MTELGLAEEAHLLVAALITIGGSISSRITKPLRELGADMAELGKGSWQPTKAHSGAIEIADLLTGYNAMVDSLHALTDEITREQIEKRKIKVAMLQSQLDLCVTASTRRRTRCKARCSRPGAATSTTRRACPAPRHS